MSENASVSSMEEFCLQEVEAFGRDADHIQIMALCSVLRANVKILYLQGSTGSFESRRDADALKVADEIEPRPCDITPFDIDGALLELSPLMYRPGHFDLLW